MELEERFWNRVKIGDPNSCWEWQGRTIKDGYGAFHFQGKRVIASRFAWILTYGEIPQGMYVLHKCDNPSCVNPRHLFLGTQKENMQDALRKGMKSGPHNGRTKLTWPQVDAIRLLLQSGWSAYRLARFFGVDYKTVWQIREGKTWREPAQVMSAAVLEEKRREAGDLYESVEVETTSEKEESEMKAKGMWLVTERVETPALTLEFPVGFFRSREAALGFVKGKEKTYRLRFVLSDLGEAVVLEKEAAGFKGEADSNPEKEEF